LVAAERRDGGLVEEIAGVERAVAQEFKNRAVERVGSGARDDADLRSGALSIFGGVGIGEDVELADGVDAQQFAARAAGRDGKLARAGVFDAIQQEQVVSGAPTRYGERVAV